MSVLIRSEFYHRARPGSGRMRGELAPGWKAPDADSILNAAAGAAEPTVEVSLMGAYVCARLLGRDDIANAIHAQGARADLADFFAQARSGMPEAMLPFERHELDLAYAASMARATRDALLRGSHTRVEGGYFKFATSHRGEFSMRYVDRSGVEGLPSNVLLDPHRSDELISKLATLPRPLARLRFTGLEDEWFRIDFDDAVRPVFLQKPSPVFKAICPISLVTRSRVTFLTQLEFRLEACVLRPTVCPVERLMELQAAALDDAWLLIEHPEFCVLAPLPDLFTKGSESVARFEPIVAFELGLGGSDLQTLPIKASLARELIDRFHWMSAPHPVTWRLLAEASQ